MSEMQLKDGIISGLGGQLLRELTQKESGLPPLGEGVLSAREVQELQRPACRVR